MWTTSTRLALLSPDSMLVPSPVGRITSRRALLASGWDAPSIRRELRSGRLVAIRRGIYAPASLLARVTRDPRLAYRIDAAAAVVAQRREVVVSHLSAAMLHRLDVLDPPGCVELTSAIPCQLVGPSVRVNVAALPTAHCDEIRGVPVTSVGRTVVDIARTCTMRNALVVADCALHRRATSPEQLSAVVAACGRWPESTARGLCWTWRTAGLNPHWRHSADC
jgi:hypothetical protein